MRRRTRGLTLIELLVVVLIIATLMLVAIPPMLNARLRAEVARVHQDMQVVESALEWYFLDYHGYPESSGADLLFYSRGDNHLGLRRLIANRYMDFLPEDRFQDKELEYQGPTVFQFGSSGRPNGKGVRTYGIPAWMLVSPGPDNVTDSLYVSQFPFGTVAWQYDPTKGVRSEGDIVRYGGDWDRGNWYLDGQPKKDKEPS